MMILSKGVVLSIVVSLSFLNVDSYDESTTPIRSSKSLTSESELQSPLTRSSQVNKSITRPLPLDQDSWETIRRNKKVYVDKTMFLEKFINTNHFKLSFLTRPRRFGKTLFLTMMQSFFSGEKSLFEGTHIYERGNVFRKPPFGAQEDIYERGNVIRKAPIGAQEGEWVKYPVIFLDFSNVTYGINGTNRQKMELFQESLCERLTTIAKLHDVHNSEPILDIYSLIEALFPKYKLPVIILIDEFDNAINKTMFEGNYELAKELACSMGSLFAQIKASSDMLGLAFVTGCTRRVHSAIGSGDNNFANLHVDKEFATAIGFTEEEIRTNFNSHLLSFATATNQTTTEVMEELKKLYKGYRFSPKDKTAVFNPTSVIGCLRERRFRSTSREAVHSKVIFDL